MSAFFVFLSESCDEMKTVFVIGNGFDINLGLHTGYQDFYDYYLLRPSDLEQVKSLKEHLKEKRYTKWADLELGLGEYTKELSSEKDLKVILHDLSDNLVAYLRGVSSDFSPSLKLAEKVFRGLAQPYQALPGGVARVLNDFRSSHGASNVIEVISFNYTDSLEKIIKASGPAARLPLGIDADSVLGSIRHIHMSIDDPDVILGVNDESQIMNESFRNERCRTLLVKPHINSQLEELVDEECRNLIRSADLICLFGVSLGETDALWWSIIGEQIEKTPARLIYFAYDDDKVHYNDEMILKRQACRALLNKRLFGDNASKKWDGQIYVGYKTNLFK